MLCQTQCYTNAGWTDGGSTSRDYWSSTYGMSSVSCPDPSSTDVNAMPNGGGVFFYTEHPSVSTPYGWCMSWESPLAATGFTQCYSKANSLSGTSQGCTKFKVGKEHGMTLSAGVFMLKRIQCSTDTACNVFKVRTLDTLALTPASSSDSLSSARLAGASTLVHPMLSPRCISVQEVTPTTTY